MRPLADADVLRLWESDHAASSLSRAVRLLSVATGDTTLVRSITPGEGDAKLLELRRLMFGATLDCVADCPSCHADLEFSLDVNELTARDVGDEPPRHARVVHVAGDGYRASVRLPTLGDVDDESGASELALLARCLVSAEHDGVPVGISELPPALLEAIDNDLSGADPGAVIDLALGCPNCPHVWTQRFDIASFLWTEIRARGDRLLREVSALARAYGWTERDVLALSPMRRARYLELLEGVA